MPDPQTIAAANRPAEDVFDAVAPPLYLTTTFGFAGFELNSGYEYSRAANPTRDLLADTLARLERGAGAVVTASGMAAIDLVLSRLGPDDLVVAPHDCYWGTRRLIAARRDRGQFHASFIDQGDDTALAEAMDASPSLVLIETPSNPLLRVVDIAAICERAHAAGALVAVDNTFLSPALQQPLRLGADIVIHSTTKYLNGHSDATGGAVITARQNLAEDFAQWANTTGVTASPFDAYMTLRGVRTLFPRVERQQATAMTVASFLAGHPKVAAVHYPGLATHPGHELAARQQAGFGAMISFDIGGGREAVRRFVETVRVFILAESLGGVESLIAHPASMTHAGMDAAARQAAGIGDGLLRLSIGLESADDLIGGLESGFAALA